MNNDSQSVTQTTTYDAFGNVESSAGSSNNTYKYAGQFGYRNDGDDGLMHVGARYYDPLVGRFITADTWLGEIGRPQSLNRYGYVENNPVNAVDPSGHVPGWIHTAWDWIKDKFWYKAAGTVVGTAMLYYLWGLWKTWQVTKKPREERERAREKSPTGLLPIHKVDPGLDKDLSPE